MTDVTQQLRTEMNETVNGRMDMLNSINTALQKIFTKTTDFKPYRISDLIPRNWEGSNEKGEFRSFMSDLHLWMQAWSDPGEQILARIESVDKVGNITERDRAKDVEQFDDILRTFTNEMTKFENRFGEGACSQEIDARELAELQVQRNGNAVR